jgi:uroporphyrinogen-III synthase
MMEQDQQEDNLHLSIFLSFFNQHANNINFNTSMNSNGVAHQQQHKRVLVLKERSIAAADGNQQDNYESALLNAGYTPVFLPVLSHNLVNINKITNTLAGDTADEDQSYSGVVFTSQRAAEAWSQAGKDALEANRQPSQSWQKIPFYAVGPATAASLTRLHPSIRPHPSLILGADESGSAERLAGFIRTSHKKTQQQQQQPTKSTFPLLYLVGDKRKDSLPSLLSEQGIEMHEIQAYETYQSPTFEADYSALLDDNSQNSFEWIIFFSPSGAKLLFPLLSKKHDNKESERTNVKVKYAAIGPTTRDYLLSKNEVKVHAMANSPTPEALVSAMLAADGIL